MPEPRWLRTPVRAFMRPGVVTVAEEASLFQAERAMISHGVHAVLIVGTEKPRGWVTAGGLLPWLTKDAGLCPASAAVSEPAAWISPSAPASEALRALAGPDVTHLVVTPRPDAPPQGVVSELDLVRLAVGPASA